MCYTGKCPYEQQFGDCNRDFQRNPWKLGEPVPLCQEGDLIYGISSERKDIMKLLNKNHKLKYSKMFIDEKTYENICTKYGTDLKSHLNRVEKYQNHQDAVPDMVDVSIIFEIYENITKVIRKR